MDYLKLFAKDENQQESLFHTEQISGDVMEIEPMNSVTLVVKKGRFVRSEATSIEAEIGYTYQGILDVDGIK